MVPTAEQFDVVVLGGGPGGYAAALYGASAGLKIAVVEKDKVGGTCLHRGCIPAKEFLETAAVFRNIKHAEQFGVTAGEPKIDFSVSQARKNKVVDGLHKGLSGLMKKRKITTYNSFGRLGPNKTLVLDDGTEIRGDSVILATGSSPRTIPGFEVDGKIVMTSDEFLALDTLPKTAAVIGGGAIGCEFASTMADLGVQVTILEALPKILPGCDSDVAAVVIKSFKKRGIDVKTGIKVNGHTPGKKGGTTVHLEGEELEVDVVVVSIGRRPLSDDIGLEGTGVKTDERGYVWVDERLRTGEEGVYTVGDLIAVPSVQVHPQLAHVGFAEGIQVIKEILGENPVPMDYVNVPWCIYCFPEVAFAGLSEEAAKAAGIDIVVSKHGFIGNGRALIVGESDGLVKVIAEKTPDGKAGKIIGVHMVGPWVTEQLGQAYLAVNWEATVDDVAQFIQPHPSLSELFGETVLSLTGRGLHG